MRPLSPRSAPAAVARRAALFSFVVLSTMSGCDAMPERGPYEVDCSPYDDVELREPPVFGFQGLGVESWYNFVDRSPRGTAEFGTVELADHGEEDRCGDTRAFLLRSHGFNDWGAGFGNYSLATAPTDATGWDGVALWARTAARSDRSVTLVLIDRYGSEDGVVVDPETGTLTPTCRPALPIEAPCPGPDGLVDCANPACCGEATECGCEGSCAASVACEPNVTVCRRDAKGEIRCASVPRVVDSADTTTTQTMEGQVVIGTEVPDRYDCGHEFSYALTTTPYWQLHLIPFAALIQARNPNLSPAGFDASAIHGFVIRTPREAQIELWLDDVTFYRRVAE